MLRITQTVKQHMLKLLASQYSCEIRICGICIVTLLPSCQDICFVSSSHYVSVAIRTRHCLNSCRFHTNSNANFGATRFSAQACKGLSEQRRRHSWSLWACRCDSLPLRRFCHTTLVMFGSALVISAGSQKHVVAVWPAWRCFPDWWRQLRLQVPLEHNALQWIPCLPVHPLHWPELHG